MIVRRSDGTEVAVVEGAVELDLGGVRIEVVDGPAVEVIVEGGAVETVLLRPDRLAVLVTQKDPAAVRG